MAEIHPFISHFPIVLIMTAAILQGMVVFKIQWIHSGLPLFLFGISVVYSIVTGLSGQDAAIAAAQKIQFNDIELELIQTHEKFANFTIWTSIVVLAGWLWYYFKYPGSRKLNILAFAFLVLISISVAVTGYYGGIMVMVHGIGVGFGG
jgi:uncharacterized membrane protein